MGDFNAKNEIFGSNSTNKNGELLETLLINSNSQILNSKFEPTFHIYKDDPTNDYHGCLDYILGSPAIASKTTSCQTFTSEFLRSDHSPLTIEIGLPKFIKEDNNKEKIYNFEKANWDDFKIDIINSIANLSDEFINNLDKNKLNELIINTIKQAMTKNIPTVRKRNENSKINLPIEKVKTIKLRNSWQKKFRLTRSPESKEILITLNKIIKIEI